MAANNSSSFVDTGLELLNAHGAEGVTEESSLVYASEEDIKKACEKALPKLAKMSTKDLLLVYNSMALKLRKEQGRIGSIVTKKENKVTYPHVTFYSTVEAYRPNNRQSGPETSHLTWDIAYSSTLPYEVEIQGLPVLEEGEDPKAFEKRKWAFILGCLKFFWGRSAKNKEGNPYKPGVEIPSGSEVFYLEYPGGIRKEGPRYMKENFVFVPSSVHGNGTVIKPSKKDFEFVGSFENSTKCIASIRIPGYHKALGSRAEKNVATLKKGVHHSSPVAKVIGDLDMGSTLMFESIGIPLKEFASKVINGDVAPLPPVEISFTQEGNKGLYTSNPASACLLGLTGKRIKREATIHHDVIGDVIWDSAAFLEFRNEWKKTSVRRIVTVEFISNHIKPFFPEEGGAFHYVEYKDGYLYFWEGEAMFSVSPLTMETSTVTEGSKPTGKGAMFPELLLCAEQLLGPVAAKLMLATTIKAKKQTSVLFQLADGIGVTNTQAEEAGITCVYPFAEGSRLEFPIDWDEAFEMMSSTWGDVFWIPNGEGVYSDPEKEVMGCLVSPTLALAMGGRQADSLRLYAKPLGSFISLFHCGNTMEEEIWVKEYKQMYASHLMTLKALLHGEEDSENVSSMLGNPFMAKTLGYTKVGAVSYVGQTADSLSVSTDHPLAKYAGDWVLYMRNPMVNGQVLRIITVGPSTAMCKEPMVEFSQQILASNCIYPTGVSVYGTAGDGDGDGVGVANISALFRWACDPRNMNIIEQIPGLASQLFEQCDTPES